MRKLTPRVPHRTSQMLAISLLSVCVSTTNAQQSTEISTARTTGSVGTGAQAVANPVIDSSATQEKSAAADERTRVKNEALAEIAKDLKGPPKSFEVRGLNLGGDHYKDVRDSKGFRKEGGQFLSDYPDTRKEVLSDGGVLFFYRDILFMVVYEDIQDEGEIRAVMAQLETKFKGKFTNIPRRKSREGNIETTVGGFRMAIGNFGMAEVRQTVTKAVDRRACIDSIAREMRQRLDLGLRNNSSLTSRVEEECNETLHPVQMAFVHRPIEAAINTRAAAEQKQLDQQAAAEKAKAASEKARKF